MNDADKATLRTNMVYLANHMDVSLQLLTYLYSKGIITEASKQEIDQYKVRSRRADALHEILIRGGPSTFQVFLDALVQSNQGHIATKLKTDNRECSTSPTAPNPIAESATTLLNEVIANKSVTFGSEPPKKHQLRITIVNIDPDNELILQDHWFQRGRFWSQPVGPIKPFSAVVFFVCENYFFIGVSGGVRFAVRKISNPSDTSQKLVCTFSNKYFGGVKGRCGAGYEIGALWEIMPNAETQEEENWGFFRKGATELFYIWKPDNLKWN